MSASKSVSKSAAKNATVPTSTANLLTPIAASVTATPTAKVPASIAVLASITAAPTVAAGTLPSTYVPFAGYTVQLTAKGAASPQLAKRMLPTAKGGACPFATALFNGQGKTLGQAWANVTATGHGQQGRGAGGYTAVNALGTYIKGNGWFVLVKPSK